jgi:hypothetical protein
VNLICLCSTSAILPKFEFQRTPSWCVPLGESEQRSNHLYFRFPSWCPATYRAAFSRLSRLIIVAVDRQREGEGGGGWPGRANIVKRKSAGQMQHVQPPAWDVTFSLPIGLLLPRHCSTAISGLRNSLLLLDLADLRHIPYHTQAATSGGSEARRGIARSNKLPLACRRARGVVSIDR